MHKQYPVYLDSLKKVKEVCVMLVETSLQIQFGAFVLGWRKVVDFRRLKSMLQYGACISSEKSHMARHTPCMCDIACNLCKRLVFGLLVSLQPRQTSQTSIHVTREQQRQHKSRIHRVETRSSQTVRRIRLLAPNVTMPISMSMSSFKSRKPSNVTPCSSNSWAYFAKLAIRCRELTARA
jgi:hypothetical protein